MSEVKFEAAYYKPIDDNVDFETIIEECKVDGTYITKYKGQLLCPLCKLAELHLVTKGTRHLQTNPNSPHEENCSLRQPPLTDRQVREYLDSNVDPEFKDAAIHQMEKIMAINRLSAKGTDGVMKRCGANA